MRLYDVFRMKAFGKFRQKCLVSSNRSGYGGTARASFISSPANKYFMAMIGIGRNFCIYANWV